MFEIRFSFRVLSSWVLVGALSGVLPVFASQQPGTLAGAASPSLPMLSHDSTHFAPLPRAAQDPNTPAAASGASTAPAKHHISPWVWVAIAAGVSVGIGAGVIAGNSQSGKTSATSTSATIGVGTGGVTAGAPH